MRPMTEKAIQPVMTEGKRGRGRPSDYDPAFCDVLIEQGMLGFSLTASAAAMGVHRDTINEWGRVHPEFSDAIKMHQVYRTAFLEGGILSEGVTGPQVNARIFALKNAAPMDWRDKQTVQMVGGDEGDKPIQAEIKVTLVRPEK